MNEQLTEIIVSLAEAIRSGRTVKISADEITINTDEVSASALEFSVE